MNLLIGRFYFRLTDSGNLIGEYSNNQCEERNYTESAIRIDQESHAEPFVGKYRSTWCEANGTKHFLAELDIRKKSKDVFLLEWRFVENGKVHSKPHFFGQGMLCGGMLIGNYWDKEGAEYIH